MKCEFCGNPHSRFRANSTTIFARYCSTICIKNAHRLRKNPLLKSHLKLGSGFNRTETGVGLKWEKWVAEKIGATHLKFNKFGNDLDWNGVRVDVKSANSWNGMWVFNRNKMKPCDLFICVCLEQDRPVKVLFIPADVFPRSGCTVGRKSKYDKYITHI